MAHSSQNKILELPIYVKLLIITVFALFASIFFFTNKADAASYTYPDCCSASTNASVSVRGNGIFLNAPHTYMEAKFSADTNFFRFRIEDGCYWTAGRDSGSVGVGCSPGNTVMRFYGTDGGGNKSLATQFPFDPASYPGGTSTAWFHFRDSSVGSPHWPLNTPNVGGFKRIFFGAQFTRPGGGLNAFKVVAEGFRDAGFTQPTGYARLGFAESQSLGLTMSLVNAPLGGGTSNYQLNFAVPCTDTSGTFDLFWFDADAGAAGIPQDYGITWSIRNDTTGQTFSSLTYAFLTGQSEDQFLGGQDASRNVPINNGGFLRVRAGDRYTWSWNNVLNTNGIQFRLPYTEVDYDIDCNAEYDLFPGIQKVTPDPANGPKPGQAVTVRSRVQNRGPDTSVRYRHRIQRRVGIGGWVTIYDLNTASPLGSGAFSPWRSATYTLPANLAHGTQVCFRDYVNPARGNPITGQVTLGARATETCYSVYNQRFHITPISVPANYGPVTPGSTIDITYGYGNTHPLCCNATRGPSTNLNIGLAVPAPFSSLTPNPAPYSLNANQSDTQTFTIDIPVNAPIGITCGFTLTLNPEQGYSDGTGTSGTRQGTTCIEVHDFAFLKVHNSGVWNGAIWGDLAGCRGFALDFSLNPQIVPEDVRGQISSNIGSSAEFGVTSMVTAITEFASAIVQTSAINIDDNLTFANSIPGSSGLGNFLNGATQPAKCLVDIYNELYDPTLPSVNSAAGVNTTNTYSAGDDISKESQAINYTDPTLGAISGFNSKVVVLRDGDLFIDSNIEYDTNYGDNGQLYIPSLVVITYGGDINIDADVTRLDGLYISIPEYDGAGNLLGGGNINTCSAGAGVNPACEANPRLEVTGAFISNDVDFYRFVGGFRNALIDQTTNGASANQDQFASELFTLNPELYISNPFSGLFNIAESVSDIYDSFTEKAPVY